MTLQKIPFFRPGNHTASDGRVINFTAADLEAAAAAYSPGLHHAPLVIGHPATDSPAYGWVSMLTMGQDNVLAATPEKVDPGLIDLYDRGAYTKVSASWYPPGAPGNPVPQAWYLRHIGFLGAQPPAVKGLPPAQFSSDRNAVSIEVDMITPTATPTATPTPTAATADFAERERSLMARETALQARETALAAQEAARQQADCAQFCEGLVRSGQLLPRDTLSATALLFALRGAPAHADFAEQIQGQTQSQPRSPDSWMRDFLSRLPVQVDYHERIPSDNRERVTFASPPGFVVDTTSLDLHRRAIEYQTSHNGVSYVDAIKACL
jgi:hypothetical protein